MKILHISSSDAFGGAAKSGINLHKAMLGKSIDSHFLAVEKTAKGEKAVSGSKNGYFRRRLLAVLDRIPLWNYKKRDTSLTFSNNWFPYTGILQEIRKHKPDIIHVHWIGKGAMSLRDLAMINVPIVWTLHDQNAFTGGCHLVLDCSKYQLECGKCPQLNSEKTKDLSTRNFNRKKKVYSKGFLSFVAPSGWIKQLADSSDLLKNRKVVQIGNAVNTDEFWPLEKNAARNILKLSPNGKVILFGAVNSTTDPNKNFDQLLKAVKILFENHHDLQLCVFGNESIPESTPTFNITGFGYLHDAIAKRVLYSAADLVIVPSKSENLSNVIMESMACGTPVVAFNTGGNPDLIDHQTNGYLAHKNDVHDLVKGVEWVMDHPDPTNLTRLCVDKIQSTFSREKIVDQHLTHYRSLVNG